MPDVFVVGTVDGKRSFASTTHDCDLGDWDELDPTATHSLNLVPSPVTGVTLMLQYAEYVSWIPAQMTLTVVMHLKNLFSSSYVSLLQ